MSSLTFRPAKALVLGLAAVVLALLLLWLPRLAPGGSAWLVVQKNLGSDSLQRWLADKLDSSFTVTRESTSKSFRILRVRKASR